MFTEFTFKWFFQDKIEETKAIGTTGHGNLETVSKQRETALKPFFPKRAKNTSKNLQSRRPLK